jgi:hypothetical protein
MFIARSPNPQAFYLLSVFSIFIIGMSILSALQERISEADQAHFIRNSVRRSSQTEHGGGGESTGFFLSNSSNSQRQHWGASVDDYQLFGRPTIDDSTSCY